MPSPDILLFDFGGVLVDLDKERCIAAFERLGFDLRPFIGTYQQAGVLSQIERGEASIAEFCQAVREESGRAISDGDIVDAWRQYLTGVPAERLEVLLRARRHYQLCVLSNTNEVHWQMARDDYFRYGGRNLDDFFSEVFLSYEMGCEKPEPEIFQRVVTALHCRPEQILFFDDSELNCAAARRCGLQARLAPAGGEWLSFFDEDGRLR